MKELQIPFSLKYLVLFLLLGLILTGCSRGPIQASSWPGATVSDNTLYIAYNQFLIAIDLENGRELWRYPAEADRSLTFYAPPAVSNDGLVILGGYDKKTYALSTSSGRPETVWVFDEATDRIIGGPAISGDIVLIPSADHRLYAVDLNSGQPVWDQPFQSDHALWSAPLVDGDTIYLASLDHAVYALELESGRLLWEKDLGSAISDTPSLSNGLLLSGTFEGLLYALNKNTGREVWRFESGAAIWGNPVVEDGVVYVANVDRDAFALDLENGNELWHQTLSSSASTSPITKDEIVFFVSEEGAVEAFMKDGGDPAWPSSATILGRLLADPILVTDELFVPVMDNTECVIFGVDTDTGSTRCVVQLDEG
jgi:outer membrane protein assembly factor BamB